MNVGFQLLDRPFNKPDFFRQILAKHILVFLVLHVLKVDTFAERHPVQFFSFNVFKDANFIGSEILPALVLEVLNKVEVEEIRVVRLHVLLKVLMGLFDVGFSILANETDVLYRVVPPLGPVSHFSEGICQNTRYHVKNDGVSGHKKSQVEERLEIELEDCVLAFTRIQSLSLRVG